MRDAGPAPLDPPSAGGAPRAGFWNRRGLIAACAGLAVAEAIVLAVFAPPGALALAPQVSAPPPFAVFHDLRWLMVYHDSYGMFAWAVAALFVFRVSVLTALVRLAWPRDVPPPPLGRTFLNALRFVAVALVLLTPGATELFTAGVVELWPFYFVAAVFAIPVLLLIGQAPFPGWWRRRPPWRPVAWAALEGIVLTAGSLAIVRAGLGRARPGRADRPVQRPRLARDGRRRLHGGRRPPGAPPARPSAPRGRGGCAWRAARSPSSWWSPAAGCTRPRRGRPPPAIPVPVAR